jgi:hypothetical protein
MVQRKKAAGDAAFRLRWRVDLALKISPSPVSRKAVAPTADYFESVH